MSNRSDMEKKAKQKEDPEAVFSSDKPHCQDQLVAFREKFINYTRLVIDVESR